MKRTAFYSFHQDHKARFVDFAGWEMPITYGSIIDEHQQTRNSGGLFDVSHMGRLKFTGRHARKFLETVLTRKVTGMKDFQCRYALVCNDAGGVLDDVIIYRFTDHWLMVVNASNREKVLQHFQQVIERTQMVVTMEDQTESTAMVAVQGPRVMDMIGKFSREVPTLKRYSFCIKNLLILKMIISRTGYTGEDGVEVVLPAKMASMAIKLLLRDKADDAAVLKPAGLGARDTLRMEAGMPLYGHELDEQTNPLEAGLDFAVQMDKGQPIEDGPEIPRFIGQDALERAQAEGLSKKLIGLKLEGKRTPRQHMKVYQAETEVGQITSGCLSPTLGHPIAMAYVKPDAAKQGDTLTIDLGSQKLNAEVVPLPFYKRSSG